MNRNLFLAASAMLAVSAHAADYRITVTDTGPQPLSPLFFTTGTSSFDLFDLGSTASLGIKKIAEGGDTSAAVALAQGAGSAVGTYGVVGDSPLAPGLTRTYSFSTDAAHPYFSFAAMLGKTNDGFIGESASSMGLDLFSGGAPQGFSLDVFGTRAWDAGTELNTQDAADLGFLGGAGNPQEAPADAHIRVHGGVVPGVGDSYDQIPAWQLSTQLAHITVQSVPEPGTWAALGLGTLALGRRRARRR